MTLYMFNGIGYDRQYIEHVFWQESERTNMLKTGLQNADGVFIVIPKKEAPELNMTPQKDIAVKGKCLIEFDNTSEQTVSQSMKELKKAADIHTVTTAESKLYGSECMQHYELSCK